MRYSFRLSSAPCTPFWQEPYCSGEDHRLWPSSGWAEAVEWHVRRICRELRAGAMDGLPCVRHPLWPAALCLGRLDTSCTLIQG